MGGGVGGGGGGGGSPMDSTPSATSRPPPLVTKEQPRVSVQTLQDFTSVSRKHICSTPPRAVTPMMTKKEWLIGGRCLFLNTFN